MPDVFIITLALFCTVCDQRCFHNLPISTVSHLFLSITLFLQRTVADILLRSQLEAWQDHYGEDIFKVVFCVGSRWANVHWGVKTRGKSGEEYAAPPVPDGFTTLKHAEQVSYKWDLRLPLYFFCLMFLMFFVPLLFRAG